MQKLKIFLSAGVVIFFTANVNAGNVNMAPIISYLLSETTPSITIENNGTLDTTFGIDGIVTHHNAAGGESNDHGTDIIRDSSGNIYVTGDSYIRETDGSLNYDMVIWKYTSAGVLDSTFGTGGIVVHHDAAGNKDNDYGRGIILDNSGNVYVTGYSYRSTNDPDMVIWKYTSEGILDTTFGIDGIVVHHNAAGGNLYDLGHSITGDSAGNLYVTGFSYHYSNIADMVIWKYTSEGILDTTFGIDGIVVHHNAAGGDANDRGNKIVHDSSGNIYVTGYSYNMDSGNAMVIWKYTSSGVLDSTFGINGIVVHHNAEGNAIALDSSGSIYVTGKYGSGMILWKYKNNGVLDSPFGTGGIVTYNNAAGGDSNDYGRGITLDSVGNTYVLGGSHNGDDIDMVIWKYTSEGILDTTFGIDGIIVHHNAAGGDGADDGRGIFLDNSGLYITGSSFGGSFGLNGHDMVIWKYK